MQGNTSYSGRSHPVRLVHCGRTGAFYCSKPTAMPRLALYASAADEKDVSGNHAPRRFAGRLRGVQSLEGWQGRLLCYAKALLGERPRDVSSVSDSGSGTHRGKAAIFYLASASERKTGCAACGQSGCDKPTCGAVQSRMAGDWGVDSTGRSFGSGKGGAVIVRAEAMTRVACMLFASAFLVASVHNVRLVQENASLRVEVAQYRNLMQLSLRELGEIEVAS